MSEGCFRYILGVLQGCVRGVSGLFQGCVRDGSGVCQGCVRGVLGWGYIRSAALSDFMTLDERQ